jgi:hypothetical protein
MEWRLESINSSGLALIMFTIPVGPAISVQSGAATTPYGAVTGSSQNHLTAM